MILGQVICLVISRWILTKKTWLSLKIGQRVVWSVQSGTDTEFSLYTAGYPVCYHATVLHIYSYIILSGIVASLAIADLSYIFT